MIYFELDWVFRLLAAMTAGIVIGFERHARAKDAGIKTHAVLALAACLLMILSQNAFVDAAKADAARVAAQVVSGIGFLGAGVIFVRNEVLKGLTTAAGIFATAAIGMTFGARMYLLGTIATVILISIQIIFDHPVFNGSRIFISLIIKMDTEGKTEDVINCLHRNDWHNASFNIAAGSEGWLITTNSYTSKNRNPYELVAELNAVPHVTSVDFL